jgi:hypothetical protein
MRFRFQIKFMRDQTYIVQDVTANAGSVLIPSAEKLGEFLWNKGASLRQIEQLIRNFRPNLIGPRHWNCNRSTVRFSVEESWWQISRRHERLGPQKRLRKHNRSFGADGEGQAARVEVAYHRIRRLEP